MLDYLERNVDITDLSNYKTPARASYYYELKDTHNLERLTVIYNFAKSENLPVLIVSWGTNMLFAFDVYNGIIVHNALRWWSYNSDTKLLQSYGAESIWDIAEKLKIQYKQPIWHRFIGLPWSIAWAVYGNAGCFGLETSSNFISCDVYDTQAWWLKTLTYSDMNFWYRYSVLKDKKEWYLVSATFDLSEIREKYSSNVDNIHFREHMQPKWNSCGSFFKNPKADREVFMQQFPELRDTCPKNISAWFLLEQVWLKGYTYGWAFFSELHSNFLMHTGQWKWTDLVYIIRLAQTKVYERFWIQLENEVQIISQ